MIRIQLSMDIEKLYDEFGNYIGPDRQSDEDEDSDDDSLQLPDVPLTSNDHHQHEDSANDPPPPQHEDVSSVLAGTGTDAVMSDAIVLAEDKQLYPSTDEVFGQDIEVLVEEEDTQTLSEPLIAPNIQPSSGLYETTESIPVARYDRLFLADAVAPFPELVRNLAIVGHLHHGKTSIVDMLFDATHEMPWNKENGYEDRDFPIRYMDTRVDEQTLKISLKTNAATLLMQKGDWKSAGGIDAGSGLHNGIGKSYAITILDTPGHTNFLDEVSSALLLVDGVIVVVDVAEGVMMGTRTILRKACEIGLSITLIISKIDRLCMELRLPPSDAYHKIQHIIDACNEVISPFIHNSNNTLKELSPAIGNVAFTCATERICFTLPQFAQAYIRTNGGDKKFPLSAKQLARRFWGNVYYDKSTRKFSQRNMVGVNNERTFVSFILKPYYKLHTAVVSSDVDDLTKFLSRNNLLQQGRRYENGTPLGNVKKSDLNVDLKAMLKSVSSNCFGMGDLSGLTSMIVEFIPSPADSGKRIVRTLSKLDWPLSDDISNEQLEWRDGMYDCDSDSLNIPFAGYVSKLLPDERGERFDCMLRILSGTLRTGDTVSVLASSYNSNMKLEDNEDVSLATVSAIFIPCARFKLRIKQAVAGQIVLVRGIDRTVNKSATIVSTKLTNKFNALSMRNVNEFIQPAIVKVSIEPIKPSDLPKMITGVRMCSNSYPGLITKVEETGEHIIIGSGELYMDCVLRDLRQGFGNLKVEVKVSDPVVPFMETVSEISALQCSAETPGNDDAMKCRLVMVAEPLEESILNALDGRELEQHDNSKLRELGWDALAAKSLWSFGPDTCIGPNALVNDILGTESRLAASTDLRDSIVQGFNWAVREGPLADEPVRGIKIRVLESQSPSTSPSSYSTIIPTSRRAVFSSILTAGPRMLEPMNEIEIICPSDENAVKIATTLVSRRRGSMIAQEDIAGTRLRRLIIHMPVLDSFGFEPDLRTLTHGAAFCTQMFNHWKVIPGDPLDRNVVLRPLEAAGRRELAREVMIKTRRRKGLGDDVNLTKYLDDPLFKELAADHEDLQHLIM